jgi:hypothetical protein
MLGIFSNKSDHPLANLKSAQQLLEALPKTDSVDVLQEISHWIETLLDPENAFRVEHQFAVLRMLDDAAHPHLRKISNSYFAALPPNAFQENRMWEAMHAYVTVCELGYLHLLRAVRAGEKGGSALKAHMPLIIARGIYALFSRLECVKVKYAQIDPQCWIHLADFYDYAEGMQCQDEILPVYAGGANANISIRRLFASVLAWYSMAVGAFKPLDLHIAKCLITHISKSFTVNEQVKTGSNFMFDLANPVSPLRVIVDGAQYPLSMRFVNIGATSAQIENLLKTLGKNLIPDELNLQVAYSAELVAEILRRLAVYFQQELPVRRHPRKKIKMGVNAAYGFLNVLEQAEEGLNVRGATSKICAVEDISVNGIRFVLNASQLNSLKIGTLIGLQPESSKHWGAGIVRRLRRDAHDNLHVGVRVLSNKAEVVLLYGCKAGNTASLALMLNSAEAQSGESVILVPPDTYSPTTSPTLSMGEQSYLLLPLALVEKGEDYDLVRYRKMEQDSEPDESY